MCNPPPSCCSTRRYLIHHLLTQYGQDERVTYAVDSRAFYIVPRLNPDGAEGSLADIPHFLRSSTKPYPRPDRLDGLHYEDVDVRKGMQAEITLAKGIAGFWTIDEINLSLEDVQMEKNEDTVIFGKENKDEEMKKSEKVGIV